MSVNGYVRQSAASIVTGLVVAAAPVNAEFNAIQTAMDATVGHAHDGTVGGGQALNMGNVPQAGTYLPLANGGTGGNLSASTSGSTFIMGAGTAIVAVKNNFIATVIPTNLNDNTQGYQVSSIWVNTATGLAYMCTSAITSTAVWISLTDPIGLAASLNKVLVDGSDTSPGQLNAKISASTLFTQSINNSGGNESVNLKSVAFTASGTNTYAITPAPAMTAYAANQAFLVIFTNGNNGSCTINVNGLGPKGFTKLGATSLVAGDIPAGHIGLIMYDGTEFVLLNPNVPPIYFSASGTNTYVVTAAPVLTAYAAGEEYNITFTNANTGPSTINFNGLGPQALTKFGSLPLAPGDIPAGYTTIVAYDGTRFQIDPAILQINSSMINAAATALSNGWALSP